MERDAADEVFADFDPTPLQQVRSGAWVESEADIFERERIATEAEIEAARQRAQGARVRLAAAREAQMNSARTTLDDIQRTLEALDAQHRTELDRLRIETERQVSAILADARRIADETIRAAMVAADGGES